MLVTLRTAAVLLAAFLLGGCASGSLRPNLPEEVDVPFTDLVAKQKGSNTETTLEHVVNALTSIQTKVAERQRVVHGHKWLYAEITTAGGVAAGVGTLADKAGLLNTGIAALLGGGTLNGLYQPHGEVQVHLKADQMLGCMRSAFFPLRPSDPAHARSAPAAKSGKVVGMGELMQKIQSGLAHYRNVFYSRNATALTKEEILALAGKVKESDDVQKRSTSNLGVFEEFDRLSEEITTLDGKHQRIAARILNEKDSRERARLSGEQGSFQASKNEMVLKQSFVMSAVQSLVPAGQKPKSTDDASLDQAFSRMTTAASDLEVCSQTMKASS